MARLGAGLGVGMSIERKPETWPKWLIGLGLLGFPIAVLLQWNYCHVEDQVEVCGTVWQKLWDQPTNVIGNTLAGVIGSLAFGVEMMALFLQARELSAATQEAGKTARALGKQADTIAQNEVGEHIEELLVEFERSLRNMVRFLKWHAWEFIPDSGSNFAFPPDNSFRFEQDPQIPEQQEAAFRYCASEIGVLTVSLEEALEHGLLKTKVSGQLGFDKPNETAQEIFSLQSKASPAKKQKLKNIAFVELAEELQRFSDAPIWD